LRAKRGTNSNESGLPAKPRNRHCTLRLRRRRRRHRHHSDLLRGLTSPAGAIRAGLLLSRIGDEPLAPSPPLVARGMKPYASIGVFIFVPFIPVIVFITFVREVEAPCADKDVPAQGKGGCIQERVVLPAVLASAARHAALASNCQNKRGRMPRKFSLRTVYNDYMTRPTTRCRPLAPDAYMVDRWAELMDCFPGGASRRVAQLEG